MSLREFMLRFDQPKDIDFFIAFRSLQLLLESGATLQQAAQEISSTQRNKILGRALNGISRNLVNGMTSGAAFRKERIFPAMVSSIVDIGDRSGNMSTAFGAMADLMYLQHNLYSKVRNALLVPKMSAWLMGFLIIAYVKLAVPEYLEMYNENGIEVPFMVSFVTEIVNGIVDYWPMTLLNIWMTIKMWSWYCKEHKGVIDRWKLRLPVYRLLHFNFLQHQFASTLQLMLSSGLTIPIALEEASKTVDNVLMRQVIYLIRKDVLTGYDLAYSMRKHNASGVFDDILISSIKAGEKSDQMVKVLGDNCDFYYKTLNDLIEPTGTKITFMVMIPMGIMIVGMFLFTLMPMFSYIGHVSG